MNVRDGRCGAISVRNIPVSRRLTQADLGWKMMLKYGKVLTIFAAAAVLIAAYELGRNSRPVHTPERTNAASSPSSSAARSTDSPNTWQKITARTKPLRNAPSGNTQRNEQKTQLPTGPFGSNIADLTRLADGGNADAAYALAKGYRNCQFFVPPKNDAETAQHAEDSTVLQLNVLDQIVDQAKNAAEKQGTKIGNVPEVPVQPVYQDNLRAGQEQVRQCTGVDKNAAGNWMAWQKRATELGNPEAELTYWKRILQSADVLSLEDLVQDKQIASAALQGAVSRGDSRALMAIGEVLENGAFAEPDPYLAYAYFYAASQAPYANTHTLPWIENIFELLHSGSNTQQYLQRHLDRTGSTLSPAQVLAAQQFGMDLFQRCCQGSDE